MAIPFGAAAKKKLLRKLDRRLIPFLALMYLLCFLDRTNLVNVRSLTIEKDLGMKGFNFNVALSMMYIFYIIAAIPSNIMMKRTPPGVWLACIMVFWGIVTAGSGFVQNYSGLLACRALLGLGEGGLFPGICFYTTMWYQRHECGFRIALFFSTATVAGAFGGLFAHAISHMNGIGGKPSWAWVFIIEGAITLLVGSTTLWVVSDYPADARSLTTEERVEVRRRLREDTDMSDDFALKYIKNALVDWRIWMNMVISIGIFTPLYSISILLPTIVRNLGRKQISFSQIQLLTVPVYIVACICTIGASYAADKARRRGPFLFAFEGIGVIGFLILITNSKPHIQYIGAFFAAAGTYSSIPLIGVWNSNNLGGSLKRAVGIAMQIGFGNLGGAIASFIYLPQGDNFVGGHAILIGMLILSMSLTLTMSYYYRRENERRDLVLHAPILSKDREREKGDRAYWFRYMV